MPQKTARPGKNTRRGGGGAKGRGEKEEEQEEEEEREVEEEEEEEEEINLTLIYIVHIANIDLLSLHDSIVSMWDAFSFGPVNQDNVTHGLLGLILGQTFKT